MGFNIASLIFCCCNTISDCISSRAVVLSSTGMASYFSSFKLPLITRASILPTNLPLSPTATIGTAFTTSGSLSSVWVCPLMIRSIPFTFEASFTSSPVHSPLSSFLMPLCDRHIITSQPSFFRFLTSFFAAGIILPKVTGGA